LRPCWATIVREPESVDQQRKGLMANGFLADSSLPQS
jgi:hypothetical protein